MAGLPGSPASLLPAGMDDIPRQIKDMQRSMQELGPSVAKSVAGIVADLQAANVTLAAQVATLATAVANIQTLVGQQTVSTAGKATTGGAASLSTGFGSFAVFTFSVPVGYTSASVNANSAAAISATNPVQIATRIGGMDGDTMNVYPNGGFGNGSSNFARVFAVTPGGTFTVETRALVSGGSGSALLTTSAGVTFSR